MKIVDQVIDHVNEMVAKPIGGIDSIKAGDVVIFKKEHACGDMMGAIIGIHKERSTVDVKVGNANKIDVPLSDLMAIDAKYAFHVGVPSAGVDSPEANPAKALEDFNAEEEEFKKKVAEAAEDMDEKAGGDSALAKKLAPHHDKIKKLTMQRDQATRQFDQTKNLTRKKSIVAKKKKLAAEIEKEHAAIRKLKGK